MAKILVLGGSRFIGRTLVEKLSKQGHQLTIVNRGTIPNEEYVPEGATHYALDRSDKDAMKNALADKKFDFVHDVSILTSKQAEIMMEIIEGNVGRHVHVSTGSVYNEEASLSLPIPEDAAQYPIGPIGEDQHPYMNNKRGSENVLWKAHLDRDYPVTFVRPTFVYGPYNYIYREAYFFDRVMRDRTVLLPNKGFGFQDLIHVGDLVDLMIELANSPAEKVLGEAFNGSSGKIMDGNMYTKQVAQVIGNEAKIEYFDPKELQDMGWPGERWFYPYMPESGAFFSAEKYQEVLGFKCKYNYAEGLKSAYIWWKEQDNKEPDFKAEDALIKYLQSEGDDKENNKELLIKEIERMKEEVELQKNKA